MNTPLCLAANTSYVTRFFLQKIFDQNLKCYPSQKTQVLAEHHRLHCTMILICAKLRIKEIFPERVYNIKFLYF